MPKEKKRTFLAKVRFFICVYQKKSVLLQRDSEITISETIISETNIVYHEGVFW